MKNLFSKNKTQKRGGDSNSTSGHSNSSKYSSITATYIDSHDPKRKGTTPLIIACKEDDNIATIKHILKEGLDVNAQDQDGNTPLHHACWNENLELVKILVKNGADVNKENIDDTTPLGIVADYDEEGDKKKIYDYLMSKGAKTILDDSSSKSSEKIDIDKDEDGNTPLHLACRDKNLELVKLLVEKGADVNEKNNIFELPLDIVENEEGDAKEIYDYLQSKGAKTYMEELEEELKEEGASKSSSKSRSSKSRSSKSRSSKSRSSKSRSSKSRSSKSRSSRRKRK